MGESRSELQPPTPEPFPFGQACQPLWLGVPNGGSDVHSTASSKARYLLRLTTHSRLTSRTPPLRLGVEPDFIPASRIDGQSLPWGKRCSPFTSAVGNCVPHRTLSCLESDNLLSSSSSFAVPMDADFEETNRRHYERSQAEEGLSVLCCMALEPGPGAAG